MAEEKQEQVSLKELVLKIREWVIYLKKRWLTIFIVGAIGGLLGFFYAYLSRPKYVADLTFVLSTQSKTSTLSGLAGQFGIDLGSSNDDMFAGDNIIELFKSRKIIKGALFKLLPDSSSTLINFILSNTNLKSSWENKQRIKNAIPFPNDAQQMTPVQDSLANEIYLFIKRQYLEVGKVDKKLSFYRITATSKNENISCFLTKYIVDEAADFYIKTKTKTARQNLSMLQHEADSLRVLLGEAIASTAIETDKTFNLNPAYQAQRSSAQQTQFKATVLGTAYGEVVKNLELAKISLQKEMPVYQIIDEPEFPLKAIKISKVISMFITSIFCAFIASCFLLAKKEFS